jgi:hypothetical protein
MPLENFKSSINYFAILYLFLILFLLHLILDCSETKKFLIPRNKIVDYFY